MLRAFSALNNRLCASLHHRLPWRFKRDFFELYYELLGRLVVANTPQHVLDVGCGQATHYAGMLPYSPQLLIGVDVSIDEIAHNRDLTHRVVSDAARTLPFADESIDLVSSRSVVEHLRDTDQFFSEVHRVLRPGGHTLHILPGRNAPFSLLNRLLPNSVTQRLLKFFYPEISGGWGFPAFYHNCSYPLLQKALKRSGFEVVELHCRYYQATYYRAFFPAYVLFVMYDLLVWLVGAKRLASQLIVIARRP